MGALKQYIDLYRDNKTLVDSGSAHVLNAMRQKSLDVLENMVLPAKGSENYEITDLESLLSPDYGINIARVNMDVNPAASFHCGVPNLSTSLFITVNDIYAESANAREGLPEGIYVGSLRRFAEEYPEIAKRYYCRNADLHNPLVALNTLLCQDGIAVWVKRGVKVEKPLQIVNILQNRAPLMAFRRVLVILEEDSDVKILTCDHTQNPDVDFLSLQTIEIFAGRNSRIDYYDLEESTEKTTRLSSIYVSQDEGSDVLVDGMTLYNGVTRNEYFCKYEAEHATLRLFGMGIEDRSRHLDTYSRVEHRKGHCNTDELFKYVLDDEARGAFTGLIKVEQGADKTEAYQNNRNIVGSDMAKMYSKPQLEIYNDDVKCSHGTAIGQLDEMQVFYMRTRGLAEKTAKFLLKQAFMADIIDAVRLPGLKERLHMLVERRFAGGVSSCVACNSACGGEEK